jgi:hydroxyacylglutathione hydrolase
MPVHSVIGVGYDSNIFLVTGGNPILVDAGTGMHTRKVLENIKRAAPDCVPKTIILTHRHFDHVGGAHELATHFQAEVVMHEKDAQSVAEGELKTTAAAMFGCTLKPLEISTVKEGDRISTGEHDFEVLHTPGHTVGGMCLFEKESGILISGDTVFANGVGRWDLPTGDHDDLERSVQMLLSKGPKQLFPGHGEILLDGVVDSIKESLIFLGEV